VLGSSKSDGHQLLLYFATSILKFDSIPSCFLWDWNFGLCRTHLSCSKVHVPYVKKFVFNPVVYDDGDQISSYCPHNAGHDKICPRHACPSWCRVD